MMTILGQGATDVNGAINTALSGGLTSSTTFAVAAVAIAVVFFTLKLGKRGLNKG
jgi:homoserine kinase